MSSFGDPAIVETFKYLENGGCVIQNPNLRYELFLPYILKYYTFDEVSFLKTSFPQVGLIKNILSLNRDDLIKQVNQNSTLLDMISEGKILPQSQTYTPFLNDHEVNLKLVLRDLYDLVIIAKAKYEQGPVSVQKCCDILHANRSLQNLKKETLSNIDYYLPIILYTWKPIELGITYEDVIRALPLLNNCDDLIRCLVANNPQMFHKITDIILQVHKYFPVKYKDRIKNMLYTMVSLATHHAFNMRLKLIDLKILPEVVLRFTILCSDIVLCLEGILSRNPKWITSQQIPQGLINELKNVLFGTLRNCVKNVQQPLTHHRARLCILMRIICGFVHLFKVNFDLGDLEVCLTVIDHAGSDRLKKLCLCFLLLCSEMLIKTNRLLLIGSFAKIVNPRNTQLFLIFAYLFRTNQLDQISKMCISTLAMDVEISGYGLVELKNATKDTLFSEAVLAKSALEIEPDTFEGLGLAKDPRDIAFNVVYVMLKGGVFHKGKIDIKPWIVRQITQATTPIHSQLGPLIKAYTSSIFDIYGVAYPSYPTPMNKIQEFYIFTFFREKIDKISPAHCLLFYYVLQFNTIARERKSVGGQASLQKTIYSSNSPYSSDLMESIPVRRILIEAEKCDNGLAYRNIYPELLGLVASNYPEIFDIENLLTEEDRLSKSSRQNQSVVKNFVQMVISNLTENPEEAISALKSLESMEPEDLSIQCNRLVLDSLPRIIHHMNPHEASLLFINATRGQEDQGIRFTESQLMMDPLLVIRCDPKVFRCPPIFKIFIKVLKFYMRGSRSRLSRFQQQDENEYLKDRFTLEKMDKLILIQEISLMKILLEICETNQEDLNNPDVLEEIRNITFSFLHELFIENTMLCRELHFEGYSFELIPLTTRKIESMHMCINFAPELIKDESNPKRQLFGLFLGSQLCEVWPMEQTYKLAKEHIIEKIKESSLKTNEKTLSKEAMKILPILVLIFNVFQNLRNEVVRILRALEEKFRPHKGNAITFGMKRTSEIFIAQLLEQVREKPKISFKAKKRRRIREI
ncbi:integrator complex subunit 2-domain-containing protein [Glomus cerebriforme]|uniref:Integrator complex subunit 2-domain-containing protein n=1 Tax=Glomus cerebriforme TaxID=658196 RepID=A0A397SP41_9GLOM|nr:integrator complex subunit 2-domain-containing protein [Glomus cerebriforme]